MNVREKVVESARYLGTKELCAYLSVGRGMAREIGEKSGARVKIGRRVIYDRFAIDQYVESLRV